MTVPETDVLHRRMNRLSAVFGTLLVDGFHYLALFAIGGAIVWSAIHSFMAMAAAGRASIDDILLLFIYLELGAMVGIGHSSNRADLMYSGGLQPTPTAWDLAACNAAVEQRWGVKSAAR